MFCSPQGLHAQLSLGPNAKGLDLTLKGYKEAMQTLCKCYATCLTNLQHLNLCTL